jgi:hypothetical protein
MSPTSSIDVALCPAGGGHDPSWTESMKTPLNYAAEMKNPGKIPAIMHARDTPAR